MYYDEVIKALNKNKLNYAVAGGVAVVLIKPFEHLEFIIKNTTPHQRYKGLEQLWDIWYKVRKILPQKIIELQDGFLLKQ